MSLKVEIAFQRLPHGEGLPLPAYATSGAAGLDLHAAVTEPLSLSSGEYRLIPTGFACALPPGFEGQVRPRSGLALKHGVTVLNAPGTIDSDYRGEIGVILINHGPSSFTVARGQRIAQLVVAPSATAALYTVTTLESSARGEGGFGSTGEA